MSADEKKRSGCLNGRLTSFAKNDPRAAIAQKIQELEAELKAILTDPGRVRALEIPKHVYVVLHANKRIAWSVDVGAALKAMFGDKYEDFMDVDDVKNAYVVSEYPIADHGLVLMVDEVSDAAAAIRVTIDKAVATEAPTATERKDDGRAQQQQQQASQPQTEWVPVECEYDVATQRFVVSGVQVTLGTKKDKMKSRVGKFIIDTGSTLSFLVDDETTQSWNTYRSTLTTKLQFGSGEAVASMAQQLHLIGKENRVLPQGWNACVNHGDYIGLLGVPFLRRARLFMEGDGEKLTARCWVGKTFMIESCAIDQE
jgi:phage terminase small subunit